MRLPSARAARIELALVPLRDLVVFPHMVVPFFVGRKRSIRAAEEAIGHGKKAFLVTQKIASDEHPGPEDIYPVGTVARILQMLHLPDGTARLLVEGLERAQVVRLRDRGDYTSVQVKPIPEVEAGDARLQTLVRVALNEFHRYAGLYQKLSPQIIQSIEKAAEGSAADGAGPDLLVNQICANLPLKVDRKIELLAATDAQARLENLAAILAAESEVLELEQKIHSKVRRRMEKTQKEFFLHEQLKEIQRELGAEQDDPTGARELEEKVRAKGLPEEVLAKCQRELKRLARMQPVSPESAVLRTYLDWIVDLPWSERAPEKKDIEEARRVLDEDHYDLSKVKERVLDFIAVRLLKGDRVRAPILCFVGPPGTGKTSLGRSVARALGREFLRVSLGGVRDEAEIRGHRKTYVGALPGKILQAMRKAGTVNPVFLLDEIDKLSSDFRGDPASALLEVLDPEQNSTFVDHYLEVPYDLSHILFITTANSAHNIPHPLRDRMEVIQIPGYTEFEKLKIAEQFLLPKQIRENGLEWADIRFQRPAILRLIRNYTMEAGVRNLEREIANVLRKIARRVVKKGLPAEGGTPGPLRIVVNDRGIRRYLGREPFPEKMLFREEKAGLAYGLAWTEMGGTLLPVEAAILAGEGELILTGSLGEVMKESARTALSFLKANTDRLNIPPDFNRDRDIHIHVPEGAIPKDGPSAGIAITAAILSAASGIALRGGYAMTGEITLTGRLLAVGGIKEKVLAAHRHRFPRVLLPEANRRDVEEIPREVLAALKLSFADSILSALLLLFPEETGASQFRTA